MHRYLLIASILVAATLAASANAAPVQIDGKDGKSAMTPRACKQIKNICDLQAIGNVAASEADNYCLANDIDAANISSCGTGASFKPIEVLLGRFDGRGYAVRNLLISESVVDADRYIGLFGGLGSDASISNLGLIDANVAVTAAGSARQQVKVGALAGMNAGTVRNVFVTGSVSCDSSAADKNMQCMIGGLLGGNAGNVQNVFTAVSANVIAASESSHYLGGLVGTNDRTISTAYSTGPIHCLNWNYASGCVAGGLIGGDATTTKTTNSFSTGRVELGMQAGPCGSCAAGGLTGSLYSRAKDPVMSNSFATGSVICIAEGCSAGGLIGLAGQSSTKFSYATGAVACVSFANCSVGGLIGANRGSLAQAFSTGRVSCRGTGCKEAGVIGHDSRDPLYRSVRAYWDTLTSEQSLGINPADPKVKGLTTQQFQSQLPENFSQALWSISPGESYPYLTVPNRWIPEVSSPSRTFPSRTTSFWGSLALVETKWGRFAALPIGEISPWEYHVYDKQKVSSNSMAAIYTMLGRLIGNGKPGAKVSYADHATDPLSLSRIDYYMDTNGDPKWPLLGDAKFYIGSAPVSDPSHALPASFNRAGILTQLGNGRLVMLRGVTGGAGRHWMLATAIVKNPNGDVTGIVANDPLLGQQVIIDMVQGSPTFRKVIEPADYQAASGLAFSATHYISVALK